MNNLTSLRSSTKFRNVLNIYFEILMVDIRLWLINLLCMEEVLSHCFGFCLKDLVLLPDKFKFG